MRKTPHSSQAKDQELHNIGRAAKLSGVSAKMIRHYEAFGLIPKARRTSADYRVYAASDLHTLRFIRRARDLGFSIKDISGLVNLWHDKRRASAEVKRLAVRHMEELDQKIDELRDMRRALAELANKCHGDDRPECPILEDLDRSDPIQ
jgi:MerR family transcriptional regulator, copper efflux regulator